MVQGQETKPLIISKLAASAGVGVETVRFYQRRGLIGTPDRGGRFRHYGPEDVRRLQFIRQAQTAGFTLEQIRELLSLDAGQDRSRARQLAQEQLATLDRKIEELNRARSALRKLARECSEGKTGPCPILTAFDA